MGEVETVGVHICGKNGSSLKDGHGTNQGSRLCRIHGRESVLPQTKAQSIEFGGFIYKNNQSSLYFYSAPFSGTPGALPSSDVHRTQDTPNGFSLAGWYHSHPVPSSYPHPGTGHKASKILPGSFCTMTTFLPGPPPLPVNWKKFMMYVSCLAGAPPVGGPGEGSPQDSTDSMP